MRRDSEIAAPRRDGGGGDDDGGGGSGGSFGKARRRSFACLSSVRMNGARPSSITP